MRIRIRAGQKHADPADPDPDPKPCTHLITGEARICYVIIKKTLIKISAIHLLIQLKQNSQDFVSFEKTNCKMKCVPI